MFVRNVFNRSLNVVRSRPFSALPRRKLTSYGLGLAASGLAACSIAAWSMEESPLALTHGRHVHANSNALAELESKVAALTAKVCFKFSLNKNIHAFKFSRITYMHGWINVFTSVCMHVCMLLCYACKYQHFSLYFMISFC